MDAITTKTISESPLKVERQASIELNTEAAVIKHANLELKVERQASIELNTKVAIIKQANLDKTKLLIKNVPKSYIEVDYLKAILSLMYHDYEKAAEMFAQLYQKAYIQIIDGKYVITEGYEDTVYAAFEEVFVQYLSEPIFKLGLEKPLIKSYDSTTHTALLQIILGAAIEYNPEPPEIPGTDYTNVYLRRKEKTLDRAPITLHITKDAEHLHQPKSLNAQVARLQKKNVTQLLQAEVNQSFIKTAPTLGAHIVLTQSKSISLNTYSNYGFSSGAQTLYDRNNLDQFPYHQNWLKAVKPYLKSEVIQTNLTTNSCNALYALDRSQLTYHTWYHGSLYPSLLWEFNTPEEVNE